MEKAHDTLPSSPYQELEINYDMETGDYKILRYIPEYEGTFPLETKDDVLTTDKELEKYCIDKEDVFDILDEYNTSYVL